MNAVTTEISRCAGCYGVCQVYGSLWCATCHDEIPHRARQRIATMLGVLREVRPIVARSVARNVRHAEGAKAKPGKEHWVRIHGERAEEKQALLERIDSELGA